MYIGWPANGEKLCVNLSVPGLFQVINHKLIKTELQVDAFAFG